MGSTYLLPERLASVGTQENGTHQVYLIRALAKNRSRLCSQLLLRSVCNRLGRNENRRVTFVRKLRGTLSLGNQHGISGGHRCNCACITWVRDVTSKRSPARTARRWLAGSITWTAVIAGTAHPGKKEWDIGEPWPWLVSRGKTIVCTVPRSDFA